MREIEKIGAMIMGLLGKMIPMKEKGFLNDDDVTALNDQFKAEADFDLSQVLKVQQDELDHLLTKEHGFDAENIELLADLLADIAILQGGESNHYLNRAILLYELANLQSNTWSMERGNKIRLLKQKLEAS